MKSWLIVPVFGLTLAIGLLAVPAQTVLRQPAVVATAVATTTSARTVVAVRVATAERHDVMSDACVFSAEAMAAGAAPQCGGAGIVATTYQPEQSVETEALVWPGDFLKLTAAAAGEAWDATLEFVGAIFGYANEKSGLNI